MMICFLANRKINLHSDIVKDEKEKIFKCDYGMNTGLGRFLSGKLIVITGIRIRETVVMGKCARFRQSILKGIYRLLESGKSTIVT